MLVESMASLAVSESRTAPAVAVPGAGLGREVLAVQPVVRAVISKVLQVPLSHPDVDDCANETLRRIVENIGRVRDGEPVAPWAVGVARHVAIDFLRVRKRERARSADLGPASSAGPELADPSPTPEDHAASAQSLESLRRALATLADGPRQAVIAYHVEGLGYEDIARRMKVPLGTVATWIARSRRALAEAVGSTRRQGR